MTLNSLFVPVHSGWRVASFQSWDEYHYRKRHDDGLVEKQGGQVREGPGSKCNLVGVRDCRFVGVNVVDVGYMVEGSMIQGLCS